MVDQISKRLRHRVRVLGELLGETMTDHHGEAFLQKVEEIRLLAKERRQTPENEKDQALQDVLKSLDDEYLISVARAFNQFLNLANIAEQAESAAQRMTPFPDASELEKLFDRMLADETMSPEALAETVMRMNCELVLTAHPTEITRRTLIQKYNRIATQLERVNEQEKLHPEDRRELERLIAEVWYTDEIRTDRPTPQDEAKWGYAVIEHSFWTAIPKVWEGMERLLLERTGQTMPLTATPITIASWMGGDRDGNPNVTAAVTDEVIRLARWMAADLYIRDIEELLAQLSMTHCTDEVLQLCGEATHEPYRYILRSLRERLNKTREWASTFDPPTPDLILKRADLFDPLYTCYTSLQECGMGIIAEGLLKRTLIRISTFGVTLVELDIRQASDKHEELLDALTQYLEIGSYREWSESARQDFLVEELETKRPLIPENWRPGPEIEETLKTFRLIASQNAEGIASYVISMARNPSDVLAVVLLLRKAGLQRKLPIVPLFETLDDLENAAWTLERLLRIPWYTQYIEGYQQVMIGYSDSAKDAGQMAAAWAQYRAQEDLVTISEKYDTRLTLFHGRGGTPGRGGGPARSAILSQPPGSVKGSMRVTEQGEMIRFKYGSEALAIANMDLVMSAMIEATLTPPAKPSESWRRTMDSLAGVAKESYREVVRDDPFFIDYFTQGTPEAELAKLALGSRPAKRRDSGDDSKTIEELRAIPWVFAWTQKRLMLPAWLGTDAAFERHRQGRDLHVLKEMISDWPFFQTHLDMLEMVLSKADAEIAAEYDNALVSPKLSDFAERFRTRMGNLINIVNQLKGQSALLERAPEIKQSLDLRNPYTDPLQFLQIELLRRSRNEADENEQVDKALLITIAGIAASMRNTG